MRAGALDRKITIQSATESQDDYGQSVETWVTFAAVWAEIREPRGNETIDANKPEARAERVFRIRWLSGVTTKMRISVDGAVYDITHIAEIGRREGLNLYGLARDV